MATATVKAALTTDRTALKARQDRALERVFLRVLFHRKRLGYDLSSREIEPLRSAPVPILRLDFIPGNWLSIMDGVLTTARHAAAVESLFAKEPLSAAALHVAPGAARTARCGDGDRGHSITDSTQPRQKRKSGDLGNKPAMYTRSM